MKKSINLLLILTTFLTGFVAFGSVTTSAYNFNQYPIACPSDFPYCDYKPSADYSNYCDDYTASCVTNDYKHDNSTIGTNNTSYTNYNAQYYGTSKCYYYSYLCSTNQYQTPTKSNDVYYTDYCAYLNTENCKNITVNPPKTNNNQTYYTPITSYDTYNNDYCSYLNAYNCQNIAVNPPKNYKDPLRNCYLNTSYCYGGTMNTNTASNNQSYYYYDNSVLSEPSSDYSTNYKYQYSNSFEPTQPTSQDYIFSDYYPITSNQGVYDSSEMYYYVG